MSCNSYTLEGMNASCKEASFGGIKAVYVALEEEVTGTTVSGSGILTIAMSGDSKFREYKLLKSTGSLTSTLNTSETSTSYFTNEVTLQFMKMETQKRIEVMGLMMSNCVVVVKDSNDKLWYLGKDNYVECSAGSATTGTALTDANHYELTLTDTSKELPYEVDADEFHGQYEPIA